MGMHDKMAMKAFLMGKDFNEFKKAADNKASTSWFLLAVTIATSYFSDGYWYLLPLILMFISILQSISATLIAERLEKIQKQTGQ